VPAQHRFGLYNEERGLPAAEPATRQNPETTVHILKARPRPAALQDYQLLPEAKIVRDQQRLWLDSRSKRPQQTAKHLPLPLLLNHQEADAVQCRQWEWPLRITILRPSAVLRYLARYVFRIAITNSRIVALDDHTVALRYKHRQSNRWRICTLDGAEFMRRFLQHVLPKGLHKVRYFGLWHPSKRSIASKARLLLHMQPANQVPPQLIGSCATSVEHQHQSSAGAADPRICPHCGLGQLVFVRKLLPKQPQAP